VARSRNIKPGFFVNEQLAECEPLARLLFVGLWTIADREGRLEDRPKRIQIEILPYDECDCNNLLQQLAEKGLIVRYSAEGQSVIEIPEFSRHQRPHHKELPGKLPPRSVPDPDKHQPRSVPAPTQARTRRADSLSSDSLSSDSLSSDSLSSDSLFKNTGTGTTGVLSLVSLEMLGDPERVLNWFKKASTGKRKILEPTDLNKINVVALAQRVIRDEKVENPAGCFVDCVKNKNFKITNKEEKKAEAAIKLIECGPLR